MKTTFCFYTIFLLLWINLLLVFSHYANAQTTTGISYYARLTNDRVGSTHGLILQSGFIDTDSADQALTQMLRFGLSASFPVTVNGNAQLEAYDSTTLPFAVSVPFKQRITDYMLFIEFGMPVNPKRKTSAWAIHGGLRLIVRRFKLTYTSAYDASLYDEESGRRSPFVPGALNIGLTLGAGYLIQKPHWTFYPYLTLGSGAPDRKGLHPWNYYPGYIELGISVLRLHGKR